MSDNQHSSIDALRLAVLDKQRAAESTALQEAYLLHRFELETGQKAVTKIELLQWLAMTHVKPDGPEFEAWLTQQRGRLATETA